MCPRPRVATLLIHHHKFPSCISSGRESIKRKLIICSTKPTENPIDRHCGDTKMTGSTANISSTPSATESSEPIPVKTDEAATPNLSIKRDASWPSVLFYIHLNILGLYGITVLFTNAYFTTVIFTALLSFIGIIGVTCGAHRLWTHRSYQADTSLRLFLMLCQTMAGQVN